MNRFALTGALALGLTLTACNNEPEEAAGSSDDSVAPAENETVNGDEIVGEGPSDDATPYAGTTGGSGDGSTGRSAGSGPNANGSIAGTPSSGTMTKGGGDTAGARPPKGSKLQKADPQ